MTLTNEQRERLSGLTTCKAADAMKKLGYPCGAARGVRPIWEGCPRLVG